MYYYGYGSSLNGKSLKDLMPSARFMMKGYLPNYEVQWRMWSEKLKGGISSIIEEPSGIVEGAIYECDEKDLKKLDFQPGVYIPEYKRETFKVLGEDKEWYAVELYRLWEPKGPFPPSRKYVEVMLAGAKEIGVSSEYLGMVENWYQESI